MHTLTDLKIALHKTEELTLAALRRLSKQNRTSIENEINDDPDLTIGQRIADKVSSTMGSWKFIVIQTTVLLIWIVLNVTVYIKQWDPYPFILLNLALSFQAAYAAPFIMMSQNRQQAIDRKAANEDHHINVKAELEIELLHQKFDHLREMEILNLTKAISDLTEILNRQK
ncbi:MAG: DUF1003 domain-containing protein [Pseudomonadota bacterium]